MSATLCIAIPTYNRASRLKKALVDVLQQIERSVQNKEDISVFASNNGSSDDTENVLREMEGSFKERLIDFYWSSAEHNQGFDVNVLKCYESSNGRYVMFLSDDDNIIDGVIPKVLEDIADYEPNVLYYNFDQHPWTLDNPYLKKTILFDCFHYENLESLKKIARCPKLTGIVLKTGLNHEISQSMNDIELGFMHVALAAEIGISQGRILHSSRFIGRPDADYRDHINFPPFIGNNLYETLRLMLSEKKLINLLPSFGLCRTDPLTSSLSYLGAGYRGKIQIPPALKNYLFATIKTEMRTIGMSRKQFSSLSVALGKFILSYVYYLGRRSIFIK